MSTANKPEVLCEMSLVASDPSLGQAGPFMLAAPALLTSACLLLLTIGFPPPCGAVSGASACLPSLSCRPAKGKIRLRVSILAAFLFLAASLEAAILANSSGESLPADSFPAGGTFAVG